MHAAVAITLLIARLAEISTIIIFCNQVAIYLPIRKSCCFLGTIFDHVSYSVNPRLDILIPLTPQRGGEAVTQMAACW